MVEAALNWQPVFEPLFHKMNYFIPLEIIWQMQ